MFCLDLLLIFQPKMHFNIVCIVSRETRRIRICSLIKIFPLTAEQHLFLCGSHISVFFYNVPRVLVTLLSWVQNKQNWHPKFSGCMRLSQLLQYDFIHSTERKLRTRAQKMSQTRPTYNMNNAAECEFHVKAQLYIKGRFGATLVKRVLTKVSMRSHVEKKRTRVVTHSKYL